MLQIKHLFRLCFLCLTLFPLQAYAEDESGYRVVLGVISDHSRITNGYLLNSKHDAFGVAKHINLSYLDNEYVGVINFKNSYFNNTTAVTYEAGVDKHGFVLGARVLLLNGYDKQDDEVSALFLSDGISLAVMPFLRYEYNHAFIELIAFDPKVPGFSFGVIF